MNLRQTKEEYQTFQNNRRNRQLLLAGLFLLIIIGGWYYPVLGYSLPLCMVLGVIIGFFRGRKWCDWCPRGSFFDALIMPISPKREIPELFKGLPFRIGFLSFVMLMMAIQIIIRWPDLYEIGRFFWILLTATTVLGIILALIFHQRTWCRFCPIGTMESLVGGRKHLLQINSELCTECKICYKSCPIQNAPFRFKKESLEIVKYSDCLKCRVCVMACPNQALSF
jgi:ferredoxin-type protein NapH